jgi:hypothetical protein
MTDPAASTHRLRGEDLTWRTSEDAIVVLDQRRWEYLSLNGTGATIWQALAGGATSAELTDELQRVYDVDEGTAERDVDAFLAMLRQHELLAP